MCRTDSSTSSNIRPLRAADSDKVIRSRDIPTQPYGRFAELVDKFAYNVNDAYEAARKLRRKRKRDDVTEGGDNGGRHAGAKRVLLVDKREDGIGYLSSVYKDEVVLADMVLEFSRYCK